MGCGTSKDWEQTQEEAYNHAREQRFHKAVELYSSAIKKLQRRLANAQQDSDNIRNNLIAGFCNRGYCYLAMCVNDSALADFKQALETERKAPTDKEGYNEEALLGRACVFLRQGALVDAKKDCQKILDKDPNNYRALTNMGAILQELGEMEEAVEFYQSALNNHKGSKPAKFNIHTIAVEYPALLRQQQEKFDASNIPVNPSFVEASPSNVGRQSISAVSAVLEDIRATITSAAGKAKKFAVEAASASSGAGVSVAETPKTEGESKKGKKGKGKGKKQEAAPATVERQPNSPVAPAPDAASTPEVRNTLLDAHMFMGATPEKRQSTYKFIYGSSAEEGVPNYYSDDASGSPMTSPVIPSPLSAPTPVTASS